MTGIIEQGCSKSSRTSFTLANLLVLAAYISTWYTNQKILQSVQCIPILGELVQQLKTQLILDHIRSTVISQLSPRVLSLFFLFHC